jgi:RNA recognition motif-containing protein
MNIYVGNLSPTTTDESLVPLFSEFGEVLSAKIIKDNITGLSRGFGFVEMADKVQGNDAIDNLDTTYFEGNIISVKEAKQTNKTPGRTSAPRTPGSRPYNSRPNNNFSGGNRPYNNRPSGNTEGGNTTGQGGGYQRNPAYRKPNPNYNNPNPNYNSNYSGNRYGGGGYNQENKFDSSNPDRKFNSYNPEKKYDQDNKYNPDQKFNSDKFNKDQFNIDSNDDVDRF